MEEATVTEFIARANEARTEAKALTKYAAELIKKAIRVECKAVVRNAIANIKEWRMVRGDGSFSSIETVGYNFFINSFYKTWGTHKLEVDELSVLVSVCDGVSAVRIELNSPGDALELANTHGWSVDTSEIEESRAYHERELAWLGSGWYCPAREVN